MKKFYISKIFNDFKEKLLSFFKRASFITTKQIKLIKKINFKKFVYYAIPLSIIYVLINKFCYLTRLSQESNIINRIVFAIYNINYIFSNSIISLNIRDLSISSIIFLLVLVYIFFIPNKKFKNGIEYGSASWGKNSDIKPYINPKFEKNILLSESERMSLYNPKDMKFARNKNVIVIGGSGSGKTRFFVKPNLMQMHSSYVITDPKGTILLECGKMLEHNNYKIKIFNTVDFTKSMYYNPFVYIRSEIDILTFVEALISNTKGDSKEDFWIKAERMYYSALIGYIFYEAKEEEKNMSSLVYMINNSKIIDNNQENAIDLMFKDLEEENPNHFAVKQYNKFKSGAKETLQSIVISCAVRLSPFDTNILSELTSKDTMELDKIGDKKTALFIIVSDTNPTFNFLASIMYTQMFNLLCERADNKYGGKLPLHVRFLLDEFANIGEVPNFEKLIATIRSREISVCPILQTRSQLKSIYKNGKDDIIIGNCDTLVFLGGNDESTLKDISNILGKETIDISTTSLSRGTTNSDGVNFQKTGRELMTKDEIAIMDNDKCIVRIRGTRPFFSNKFDITKHNQYKNLLDYDKNNFFDIKKYLKSLEKLEKEKTELNLKQNDEIVLQIDEKDIDYAF